MSEESEDLGSFEGVEFYMRFPSNIRLTLGSLDSIVESGIDFVDESGLALKSEVYSIEISRNPSGGTDVKLRARRKTIKVDINEYQNV